MKICFICDEYLPGPTGGIGSFLRHASRWLVKNGHQVRVIGCYEENTYDVLEYENDNGIEIYRIKYKQSKFAWILAWRKQYNLIKKWIKLGEIDLVEAPDSRGWFAFWGKTNVPLIIKANGTQTAFNHELGDPINKLTAFLEKKSYQRADYYCGVSKYIARVNTKYLHLKKEHTIIYNTPFNIAPQVNKEREKDLVVFAGTLIRKKGVINLVQASILLQKRNVAHRLILNGRDFDDPEHGSMMIFLENLIPSQFKAYYTFNGPVTQDVLCSYYEKASVAVFPSYIEAFANAPMEAMAMGCPTIHTKLVSGPELIDNGKDGILVEPSDNEEIANAIEWCLKEPDLAAKLGLAGREKIINSFSFQKTMEQNVAYYQNVIQKFKESNNK